MIESRPPAPDVERPLPPRRQIATGLVLGIVIGLVSWMLILQLFGGVDRHFTFAP